MQDVSFDVRRGVTGLLGPNGAGKTTLLELVATLRRPAAGSLEVHGLPCERVNYPSIRARSGFLPQHIGFPSGFTATDFVEYAAWLKGLGQTEATQRAAEALDAVGISPDKRRAKMRSLSGGTARRAGIAAAIVSSPDLLILDEPTAGLDPTQRVAFRKLISRLGQSRAVILSTHLIEDVLAMADATLILAAGRIAFAGATDSLIEDAATRTATELEDAYARIIATAAGAHA